MEEYVRELVLGDLNMVYMDWKHRFIDFLEKVNKYNIDFMFYSTIGVGVISSGLILIFLAFGIYEVVHMRRFYKILFDFDVS
jgi:hypothetical protein